MVAEIHQRDLPALHDTMKNAKDLSQQLNLSSLRSCCSVFPLLSAGDHDSPDQQVRDALYTHEQQLAEAENNQDKSYFQKELDDALIYVASDGLVLTKSKLLESLNYIDGSRYAIKNMKVRSLGADAGLVTYDLLLTGNVAGHDLPAKQYASSVWVKHYQNWVLVFHQSTPVHH